MKRKKKAPSDRSRTPTFQPLPSSNQDIRRRVPHEGAADALVREVNRAPALDVLEQDSADHQSLRVVLRSESCPIPDLGVATIGTMTRRAVTWTAAPP